MEKCECGKEFKTLIGLASHKQYCKVGKPRPKRLASKYKIKDDLYRCECGKEFDNHQSLNAHLGHCLIHRNGKPAKYNHKGTNNWEKLSEERVKEIHRIMGKSLSKIIRFFVL